MSYRELVKRIPHAMYERLSEKLMDVLLEAKGGGDVPSSLAKTILYYWQRDQLASEAGLVNLLQAVEIADPEGATAVLDEFGLEEVKLALRPAER
ncbi:hypothetical protein DRO42_03715 [Candidatus Bathyarchaeota archaeon]|nr:MAG: hypothetical protein DRO42_03715 [Candidatus Bathyarchaeota archaeon]